MNKLLITFDGGTSCNQPAKGFGKGYGSFKVGDHDIQRVEFGMDHSNNSAEVRTLVKALEYAKQHFDNKDIIIKGDSKIALDWVFKKGLPQPFNGKMPSENFVTAVRILHEATLGFNITTFWHPRKESVKLFGH